MVMFYENRNLRSRNFVSLGAGILTALGVSGSMAVGAAPFAAAVGAAAVGAAGYGAYAAGSAMSGGNKESSASAPAVAPLPSAPTPETAQNAAQAAIEKQKRMRALAGGKTILTSAAPTLSNTTGGKSLLGS